jgi:two-component system, sensor histidine kinase PdtaS
VGPLSIAAPSNEKSPDKSKRAKRQGQCLDSDIIDLAQSNLAVTLANFFCYGILDTAGRAGRLHDLDGVQTVAFKQYLEDLCGDFSAMLSAGERPEQAIVVEAIDVELQTVTGIPLGFIVNELITNAAKYGTGRITVRLEQNPGKGYALSVSNDGPVLPEGFDPDACKGLGMMIIRSFVERIGGELRISRGGKDQGTRFTVLFS